MNMLIGPNGTGKSTVVAAIALGLGSSPAVVGRSKNVTEFIKYNAGSATIELILKSECANDDEDEKSNSMPPFLTIKRVIRRTELNDSQSDWYINGNISNQREVVACSQRLGVQISNLCQFLPQDKVSEFANMTPEQMLVATMEAAASDETNMQFAQLVRLKKEERKLADSLKSDTNAMGNDQRILADLQTLKQRVEEREERRKKLNLLKMKRPWLLYQRARALFNEVKVERDRLKAELQAATQETDRELNRDIKGLEYNLTIIAKRLHKAEGKVLETKRDVENIHAKAYALASKIQMKKNEIARNRVLVQKTREKHDKERQELRKTEENITQMQREINSENFSVNVDAADRESARINREMGVVEGRLSELTTEQEQIIYRSNRLRDSEVKMRAKIDYFKNLRVRRLEAMSRLNPATVKVVEWLEANKQHFRGNVVGPIALDLQVKDEKMAQGVESVISKSILFSFVCDNVEDHDEFTRVCEQNHWMVNSVLFDKYHRGFEAPKCPWSQSELKALGFDGVVADLLEGPDVVLAALYDMAKIHMIPICRGDDTEIDITACERSRGLVKFLSEEKFFEIKRSRYNDRDVATKSSFLKPGFILSQDAGVAGVEIPALQARIDKVRVDLNREHDLMRGVLQRIEAANGAMADLKAKQAQVSQMKGAALVKKADLKKQELAREKLRKSVRDALNFLQNETDETEALDELTQMIRERTELLGTMQRALSELHERIREAGIEGMTHKLELAQLKELKNLRDQRKGVHETLQRQIAHAESDVERAKINAQDALKVAEMEVISPAEREALALIPDDLDALDRQIATEMSWINAGGSGAHFGKNDLEELEKKALSVQELTDRIEACKRDVEGLKEQMDEIGGVWRQSVDEMILRISEKFERFFSKISCTGKVTLGIPPSDPTNFDAYYLAIWVKFRASESLQRLTGQRQSGGEKSVSTILYLLSLQELSRSPFRVVDEINQGMDVDNERRVHALMVETATSCGGGSRQAQYFLITPKLLTGLEYHERMHILCIFNGPGVTRH